MAGQWKIRQSLIGLCFITAICAVGCKEEKTKPVTTSAAAASVEGDSKPGAAKKLESTGIPECDKYYARLIECQPNQRDNPATLKELEAYKANAGVAQYRESSAEQCTLKLATLNQSCGD